MHINTITHLVWLSNLITVHINNQHLVSDGQHEEREEGEPSKAAVRQERHEKRMVALQEGGGMQGLQYMGGIQQPASPMW